MSKTKLLRSMLCLLLGLVCSVGWADTAPIAVSTSTTNPENQFYIRNGNNLYMGAYTSPSKSNLGLFAFFAEDAENGKYKIYSIRQGKWVSYTSAGSYTSGTNKAVLVEEQSDANVWNIATCTISGGESGYEIRPYQSDGNIASIYMNWFGGTNSNPYDNTTTTVGLYGTAASGDKGSGWVLIIKPVAATEEQISEAKSIIKVAVGYPTTTSDAYTALQALTVGTATSVDVDAAVNNYKTSSDILLPEDGKAYTIANYSLYKSGTTRYLNYTAGSALSVSEEEANASVFVCRKLSDGVYAFITEDGKVLTWMGNAEGFQGEGSLLGYSSNYGMTYSDYSDWNDITVKKNRTGVADFGLVRMVARRSKSQNSSFIIKGTTGTWDRAGDAYFYQNSDDYYSSAWIFTEVVHTNNTAETLALAKIDTQRNAANLGEGIGYYSYTVDGTKLYTVEDVNAAINAATTAEAIEAILNSYAVNLPETGKYYRLKGKYSGKYMDASALVGSNIGMTTNNTGEGTIFYLTADNKLQSVLLGTYLKETYKLEGTAEDANVITFMPSQGGYVGYLTLRTNASGIGQFVYDNDSKVDRVTSYVDGRCDWMMEEVPVTSLTVEAPSVVKAEATWNGETKTLPATWAIFPGSTISSPTLTISYNAANYTFTGLTEGETSLGESVEIATLDADRTITAGFTPAFFSASTAEEDLVPVSVYNLRNNDYTIRLNTADNYTDHAVNSGTTVYGENEIWYLVGTAESFKMYSRTAGTDLALTLAGTTEGSAATMTAEGTELCLTLTDNGYAISPKTNTGQSFNMYGGKGNDIKLYYVSDDGSVWGIQKVAVDKPLTLSVAINGTQPYATNTRVGHLSFTVDGVESTTLIKDNVASQVHYLPAGATYSLGSDIVYRGYTFEGFLDADGNAATYEDATLPDGGISLTATYAVDADNKYQYLAYSPDETYGHPYRIPAITTASNGDVIAAYDYRPCGNDIGSGEVDIMIRRSSDNGATWTDEVCIADGQGGNENVFNVGFGDAAIVADRESGKVLIMSVAGKQSFPYGSATGHNFMACIRSNDNGQSWEEEPEDVTSLFMTPQGAEETVETALFPNAYTMFFGSGRLLQSRVYKAEGSSYYRVYGALVIKNADDAHADSNHNFVVYSDDFGETWKILGGSIEDGDACSNADEPKVEELADGSIVLSTRKSYGRWFNVFTFTDKAAGTGSWSTQVASNDATGGIAIGSNACNGEIMKVKAVRNSDGTVCDLMLQSIPTGNSREKVTVYYKEMEYGENDANVYTPTTFAENWSKGLEVSSIGSAYSTMTLQNDGNIGFFYEEEPSGYCLVYVPLSLSEMTNDAYSLYNDSEEAIALIEEAEAALACTGVGYPTATAATRTALTEAVSAVKTNASYEGIATLNAALSAYTTSTEEIQMPQDGDTYVIYNVLQGATSNTAATNNVLRYDETSGVLTVAQKSATDDDAEKFVCRVIDAANNLYAFVNAKNGKFVLYYSPKSTEAAAPYAADNGQATGFASSYNNVSSNDSWLNPVDANDLFLMSQADTRFGTMSISCKADKVSWVVDGWCTMVIDDNEIYMNSGRADGLNSYYPQITYDAGESCLFAFEKVAYPNNVKLNTIQATDECIINLGEGNGVGTFSAPFATLLPTGVKAWYAIEKNANGALLEVAEGLAIPANQGVILVGEPGISNALMIPAKTNGTEAIADIDNNLFLNTAGTTHTLEAGDFVLGNRVLIDGEYYTKGAAFYQGTIGTVLSKNKAYIQLGSNNNVKAFGLDFGGRPTGIDAIATDDDTSLPVYDISGRRVSQLQKGGIYIRGGKKFIVK